jgi:hypothetical protein
MLPSSTHSYLLCTITLVAKSHLESWLVADQLFVYHVCLLQVAVNGRYRLLAVLVVLYRVHSTAWPPSQCVVKLGVLTEPACMAQERVLLIVVYSSANVSKH